MTRKQLLKGFSSEELVYRVNLLAESPWSSRYFVELHNYTSELFGIKKYLPFINQERWVSDINMECGVIVHYSTVYLEDKLNLTFYSSGGISRLSLIRELGSLTKAKMKQEDFVSRLIKGRRFKDILRLEPSILMIMGDDQEIAFKYDYVLKRGGSHYTGQASQG